MYCSVKTATLNGIESIPVTCESDVSNGLPNFSIVGLLSTEIKESRERVRTAIKNSKVKFPASRITVNISPASIRKSGTGFDLPIAVSILGAYGQIKTSPLKDIMMIGEMNLTGEILPIKGVLSACLVCKEMNIPYLMVPEGNKYEATMIPSLKIIPVKSLKDVIEILKDKEIDEKYVWKDATKVDSSTESYEHDFKDLKGHKTLRRAMEVAVSGMHNLLMIGPPGAGKTMAASCVPSILPPMSAAEQIEVSKIYSAAGLLRDNASLINHRPFRSPHHTISNIGLVGGGGTPIPGEITLATSGILFLDELLEFKKESLELLRQPMEDHCINISRSKNQVTFPADFMLIAASNPCPCGYYPDFNKCECTRSEVHRYLSRLSGPLMDRIDIIVSIHPLTLDEMSDTHEQESSKEIQKRVIKAMQIQRERFKRTNIEFNSRIPTSQINKYCALSDSVQKQLLKMLKPENITVRSYNKLLKLARTIADLDGSEDISIKHLKEASNYIIKGAKCLKIY
jgi:magnesium chelatase family protein